jgi:hypothetical protein
MSQYIVSLVCTLPRWNVVSVFLIYHEINGTIIKHWVGAYIFPIAGSISTTTISKLEQLH